MPLPWTADLLPRRWSAPSSPASPAALVGALLALRPARRAAAAGGGATVAVVALLAIVGALVRRRAADRRARTAQRPRDASTTVRPGAEREVGATVRIDPPQRRRRRRLGDRHRVAGRRPARRPARARAAPASTAPPSRSRSTATGRRSMRLHAAASCSACPSTCPRTRPSPPPRCRRSRPSRAPSSRQRAPPARAEAGRPGLADDRRAARRARLALGFLATLAWGAQQARAADRTRAAFPATARAAVAPDFDPHGGAAVTERRQCIIGAGYAGNGVAKAFRDAGIPYDHLEQTDHVGGNWAHGVYDSTHIISSRDSTQYADFPMPRDYPDFPSREQVLDYLNAYVDHFGLRERIEFGSEVVRLTPLDERGLNGWRVELAQARSATTPASSSPTATTGQSAIPTIRASSPASTPLEGLPAALGPRGRAGARRRRRELRLRRGGRGGAHPRAVRHLDAPGQLVLPEDDARHSDRGMGQPGCPSGCSDGSSR